MSDIAYWRTVYRQVFCAGVVCVNGRDFCMTNQATDCQFSRISVTNKQTNYGRMQFCAFQWTRVSPMFLLLQTFMAGKLVRKTYGLKT